MPRPPSYRTRSSLLSERPAHLPHPNAPWYPSADTTTYKDLLLFEERLKMNAQMLNRRRRRYEAFLVSLVISIFFLAHRMVFHPSELHLVRYLTKGLLAVALVTLVLFFASGMYQERIVYANKYVPHANRALRSINMHLNMRRQGGILGGFGRAVMGWVGGWVGQGQMQGQGQLGQGGQGQLGQRGKCFTDSRGVNGPVPPSQQPSTIGTTGTTSPPRPSAPSSTAPPLIPPIPTTTNPRGELIFSSRIPPAFKEGYERYRSAFERRRAEKVWEARVRARWWVRVWVGLGSSSIAAQGQAVGQGQNGMGGMGKRRERSRSSSPAIVSHSGTGTGTGTPTGTMGSRGVGPLLRQPTDPIVERPRRSLSPVLDGSSMSRGIGQ